MIGNNAEVAEPDQKGSFTVMWPQMAARGQTETGKQTGIDKKYYCTLS